MAEKPDPNEGEGASGDASREKDRTVPLAALEAERDKRQALEREMAELRGTVEGMKASQKPADPPKEPPVFTRAQLRQAVTEGKISEAEMDTILDKQAERQAEKVAGQKATEIVNGATAAAAVSAEIDRFKQAVPDLGNKGSEAFKAVAAKFQRLVALGNPPTLATELAALEAVYGSPEKLQKSRVEPESHEDVGGSAGAEGGKASGERGKLKDFTPREKAYYGRQIDEGVYKSWDEVRSMLNKHASPDLRQRNADRVYRRSA